MKWKSRKFWVTVAAVLASIGTSITGLATSNPKIATIGIICTVISSAIYAGCEAYVDGVRAGYVDEPEESETIPSDVDIMSDDGK